MSSEVAICNLALAHLGDEATVTSIDPPEGSAQADHCALFYPIARNTLLELHNWNFATTRTSPALLAATVNPWAYAYAIPALLIKALAVLPPDVSDDYAVSLAVADASLSGAVTDPSSGLTAQAYIPQPYALEVLSDGTKAICTNQESAVLRYVFQATDPAKFSPLFVLAASWMLASMLAGPLLKGDVGRQESQRCLAMVQRLLGQAGVSDAQQQFTSVSQAQQAATAAVPAWIRTR